MEAVSDEEEVAIDAIPLSTKPLSIVNYKIIKEGKISIYQMIRVDGSSKRYSAVIHNALKLDREIWKLYVGMNHHVEDLVWSYIQGSKVTIWKLFDTCGVHFVRFSNLHIFMLVEKRYPLTKATIKEMLDKKLQVDHWNEMCYQLLKLMTKQLKNQ
ncbi:hypothetical protein Tco_0599131 [Tanacetum coccineum]